MTIRGTSILFTAAGRRVSLVRQFEAALRALGDGGLCLTADAGATAPTHQVGHKALRIPRFDHADYIPCLLDICAREQVRLLVPLIDPELPVLAQHRSAFAAIDTTLLLSDPATLAIGNDKRATQAFLTVIGVATPRTIDAPMLLNATDFPVFVKPPDGSASDGALIVRDLDELRWRLRQRPDLLVQQLLSGAEYTVDVWVDPHGVVRCAVPRRRLEVRAGEVSKGVTVRDAAIIALSQRIAAALPGARGCLTLQMFKAPDGALTVIEINPRFGGGFPLSGHAGADFPLWALQELRGETPDYARGQAFRDGLMMLRYDDELIVDAASLESLS